MQIEMRSRLIRDVVYFLYLFLGASAHPYYHSHQSRHLLDRLLSKDSPKPLVVFLNLGSKPRSSDFDDLINYGGDDGLIDAAEDSYRVGHHHGSASSSHGDIVHLLHNLLRQSNEDTSSSSSSSSEDSLDLTKHALRTALRARCQRVDSCVRQCPAQRPSCPMNCQQVYDDMNLCPPPPPPPPRPCNSCNTCNKPKCGKTMPPGWRF